MDTTLFVLSILVGGCGCSMPYAATAPSAAQDAGGTAGGTDTPSSDAGGSDAGPPEVRTASCDVEWSDLQIGTELDDQIWGMAIDENQNIYVSGFEHGVTGVTNIEPDGNSRGIVIRIDPTGTVEWKASLDTDATDTVEDIVVEAGSGTVYGVGRTSGAFAGAVNQGQFDTFLVALDNHGRAMKIEQSGDERPQHPARLSLGADGAVAIVGFDDTYIPSNYVASWEDGFVASFDRRETPEATFSQRFLQKVPTAAANRMTGVAVDHDGSGNLYVTSHVNSGAGVGSYVTKLRSDGSTLWSTRISSLWQDAVNGVALSPSDELLVVGGTFQSLGAASFGQEDAFVMKVDRATGAILWTAQAGSPDTDYPTALAVDDAGNIYISGYTLGSVARDAINRGGFDVFAMKLDSQGALLSSWQTGTGEDDFVTSMVVDQCGRVFVGGYTRGTLVPNPGSAGGYDMFVVRAAL